MIGYSLEFARTDEIVVSVPGCEFLRLRSKQVWAAMTVPCRKQFGRPKTPTASKESQAFPFKPHRLRSAPGLTICALLLLLNISHALDHILQNFSRTRVELGLCTRQLDQITQWLGRIQDIAHDAAGLIDALDEQVLGLLDGAALVLGIALLMPTTRCRLGLGGIELQACVLHRRARLVGRLDALVQRSAPAREELALDLLVLVQARLADLLLGDRQLLQALRQRVGLGRALRRGCGDGLGARERGTRDCVVESLGLRLGARWSGERCLSFRSAGCLGQQIDL